MVFEVHGCLAFEKSSSSLNTQTPLVCYGIFCYLFILFYFLLFTNKDWTFFFLFSGFSFGPEMANSAGSGLRKSDVLKS